MNDTFYIIKSKSKSMSMFDRIMLYIRNNSLFKELRSYKNLIRWFYLMSVKF